MGWKLRGLLFVLLLTCSSMAAAAVGPRPDLDRLVRLIFILDTEYVTRVDWAAASARGVDAIRDKSLAAPDAFAACMARDDTPADSARHMAGRLIVAMQCSGSNVAGETADPLIDSASRAIVEGLDPRSRYYDSEGLARLMGTGPDSAAVGLRLSRHTDSTEILWVMPSSPAERAGIAAGDLLLAIDGQAIGTRSLDETAAALRGPLSSKVRLKVGHPERGVREIEVERVNADVAEMAVLSRKLGQGLAVRLFNLPRGGADKLRSTIERDGKDARFLILDLRSNPGGLFDEAVAIAELFLNGGEIVTSRSAGGATDRYQAKRRAAFDTPMVVLVDRTTGAGAEIIASALQDNKRALVAGERSFGAGTVQTFFWIGPGRGMALTTSSEIRPNGKPLSEAPVVPDCLLDMADDEAVLAAAAAFAAGDRTSCKQPALSTM